MNDPNAGSKPSIIAAFFTHLFAMPRWHKSILSLAALLVGGGLTGQVAGYFGSGQQSSVQSVQTTRAPGSGAPVSSAFDANREPDKQPEPSFLTGKVSPWATKVGFTFIAGFVLGWAFRAFIKTMATITALGAALLVGLSYFNVLNLDLTGAKTKYQSSMSWVTDQAGKLKDAAWDHIPHSAGSFFGMFVGFRRKKT